MFLFIPIKKITYGFFLINVMSLCFLCTNQSFAKEKKDRPDSETYFLALLDSSRVFATSDFKKALSFVDKARVYAESEDMPEWTVKVWNQYGSVYFKIGLIDPASEFFLKSSELLDTFENKNLTDLLSAKIGLGAVHLFLGDFDKSQEYFTNSLNLLDSAQSLDFQSYSSIYNNLGIIYREQGDFVQAYITLEKGIKILESNPSLNGNLPLLYNNLGEVYLRMKNYEDAMKYFQQSLDFPKRKNDLFGIALTYKNIGILYEKKGDKNLAVSFFRKAYDLAKSMDALIIQEVSSSELASLYKELGKSDSSLYFLELKQGLLEKINQQNAKQQLLAKEIESKYKIKQEELSQKSASREITYFIFLTVLVVISFSVSYYFLRLRKKYSKITLEAIESQLQMEKTALDKKLLQAQVEEKDKQIITNLVYAVKRNQLITEAVEKLVAHRKNSTKEGQEVIRGVIHNLKASQEDKIFEEFEMAFLNLHQDFFKNLLAEFPQLSLNEKRLCAFIRLNLGTKEIASITGQTIPTLNMAKVRLRKRLGLTHTDQDLHGFLTLV
jgi:tetratricopeptide (TPR) repeat protein